MNRPLAGPLNDTGIDESTDAYDTIDWLVKNTPESNGKVGIIGSSYLGFTTLMAEINPHPALKAAVPQSPMVDGWMGDDWFHNGAFRISAFDYASASRPTRATAAASSRSAWATTTRAISKPGPPRTSRRCWASSTIPASASSSRTRPIPTSGRCRRSTNGSAAQPLTVPTMLEVGQWDQEDSYGAPAVYRALEPKDKSNDMVSLLIGPWRHSGANHYGYDLGALTFTGDTAREWRVQYVKPFFDHWLKGGPDPHTPPVLTYATGVNQWQKLTALADGCRDAYLPGRQRQPRLSNARKRRGMRNMSATLQSRCRSFRVRSNMGDATQWKPWLVRDQRFVSDRPDVASWKSAPLDKPVHIMGAPAGRSVRRHQRHATATGWSS